MSKQKYKIPLVRIGYGFHIAEIEAESQDEAEQIALDNAGDYEYSEKSSEYEIEGVSKMPPNRSKILDRITGNFLTSGSYEELVSAVNNEDDNSTVVVSQAYEDVPFELILETIHDLANDFEKLTKQ